MPRFLAPYSRTKLAGATLAALTGMSAWIGVLQDGSALGRALLLMVALIATVLLPWIVSRFWTGPLLEIDTDGIKSRTPAFYLPWGEVSSVRLRANKQPLFTTYQLVVRPKEPGAVKEQARRAVRNPMLTALDSAWIPLNLLAVHPHEIAAAVTEASGLSVADVEAKLDPATWEDS